MPYTVRPDGTILADTLEEAMALSEAILGRIEAERRIRNQRRGGDANFAKLDPGKLRGISKAGAKARWRQPTPDDQSEFRDPNLDDWKRRVPP